LVCSSFSTPIMTVLFVLLTFIIGRFSTDIKLFSEIVKDPLAGYATEFIYRIIPHLDLYNLRSQAVYGGDISYSLIFNTTIYTIIYCSALLILAIIVFEKKEFK